MSVNKMYFGCNVDQAYRICLLEPGFALKNRLPPTRMIHKRRSRTEKPAQRGGVGHRNRLGFVPRLAEWDLGFRNTIIWPVQNNKSAVQ